MLNDALTRYDRSDDWDDGGNGIDSRMFPKIMTEHKSVYSPVLSPPLTFTHICSVLMTANGSKDKAEKDKNDDLDLLFSETFSASVPRIRFTQPID